MLRTVLEEECKVGGDDNVKYESVRPDTTYAASKR